LASFFFVKIWARLVKQLLHGHIFYHEGLRTFHDSPELTIEELPLRCEVQRRCFPMLEERVGEGAETGPEREEMVIVFKVGPRYREERLSGNELKDKAAKTPDGKGFIDSPGENQFGSPKTERGNGLGWGTVKEIRCFSRSVSMEILSRLAIATVRSTNRHPCRTI
jgi:hypothetical protein